MMEEDWNVLQWSNGAKRDKKKEQALLVGSDRSRVKEHSEKKMIAEGCNKIGC